MLLSFDNGISIAFLLLSYLCISPVFSGFIRPRDSSWQECCLSLSLYWTLECVSTLHPCCLCCGNPTSTCTYLPLSSFTHSLSWKLAEILLVVAIFFIAFNFNYLLVSCALKGEEGFPTNSGHWLINLFLFLLCLLIVSLCEAGRLQLFEDLERTYISWLLPFHSHSYIYYFPLWSKQL